MTKKGPFFGPQNVRKSRRAKMGLPSIDGAVRQNCAHRGTTLQELDNLLGEYDLKRDLVEINRKAPQWSHNAVWNKKYMEPKPGFTLQQLWANSESAIAQKTSPSYEVRTVTYAEPSRPSQQCPPPHCPIVHSSRHWEPQWPEWSRKWNHWHNGP